MKPSLEFQLQFSAYIAVASLSIQIWDILNNVKNDYQLLFWHRLGVPTMVYLISRVFALGYAILTIIFSNNSLGADCMAIKSTSVALLAVWAASTFYLCFLRVCAVWHWNRLIVGFFGISWLSIIASNITMTSSVEAMEMEGYCTVIVVKGSLILAPFITGVFNQTIIFLAITYGICKNTLSEDVSVRDGIPLILGKSLPTFSRALLHDSQISYIIIMVISAITLAWVYGWPSIQVEPSSFFRIALIPAYISLMTILICRVYRDTKLELYRKALQEQSSGLRWQSHTTSQSMVPSNPRSSQAVIPIQITVGSHVDESRNSYPPTKSQKKNSVWYLDFGTV